MRAYRSLAAQRSLPNSEIASARVLCVPLWSDMTPDLIERVAVAIDRIREAGQVMA